MIFITLILFISLPIRQIILFSISLIKSIPLPCMYIIPLFSFLPFFLLSVCSLSLLSPVLLFPSPASPFSLLAPLFHFLFPFSPSPASPFSPCSPFSLLPRVPFPPCLAPSFSFLFLLFSFFPRIAFTSFFFVLSSFLLPSSPPLSILYFIINLLASRLFPASIGFLL